MTCEAMEQLIKNSNRSGSVGLGRKPTSGQLKSIFSETHEQHLNRYSKDKGCVREAPMYIELTDRYKASKHINFPSNEVTVF